MKLSVIMVCLNSVATIRGALESVAAQTYRFLELVVVDGGSSDGTMEIVAEFGGIPGSRTSGPDQGIYDAMNRGVMMATGDWLYFLNSDDRFADENVVQHAMDAAASFTCDVLYGDVDCVYPRCVVRKSHANVSTSNIGYEGLCHQSIFARRDAFERIGGFDLRYRIAADYDWVLRASFAGLRMRHIPVCIARYSMSGFSGTHGPAMVDEVRFVRLRHLNFWQFWIARTLYRARRKMRRLAQTGFAGRT